VRAAEGGEELVIGIAGKPCRCAYGRLRQQRGDVEACWAGDPPSCEMPIPPTTRQEALFLSSGGWMRGRVAEPTASKFLAQSLVNSLYSYDEYNIINLVE
jgi:hypothetical protein